MIERFLPAFVPSITMVRVMCLAVIPSTINAIFNASLLGREKSKTVLTAGLIYLITLISSIIILWQVLGTLGLACALTVAQTVQAIYLLANRP